MASSPDLLLMAESGLLDAVVGDWEISHDAEDSVWGRAVVKGLKDGVILTGEVIPCSFGFRHAPCPKIVDVFTSKICITWGTENSYATLETFGKDFLKWRLPPQEEDGLPGEATVWRRMRADDSKDQVPKEVVMEQERAGKFETAALSAAEELAELRATAADGVCRLRSASAVEIAAAHTKALNEMAQVQAQAALAEELAEAYTKVADEIALENETLRVQLSSQVGGSDQVKLLRDQVKSLRVLIMEMMSQTTPSKPSVFMDLLEDNTSPTSGSKSVRHQDGTPDKGQTPQGMKRRRVDAVSNDKENIVGNDNISGLSFVTCGA